MDIKIFPKPLHGSVEAIPAKSHLHRVLIANFLSQKKGYIDIPRFLNAKDIESTKSCLSRIKASLEAETGKSNIDEPIVLYCGESATTLRLLLPTVCALGINAVFLGEPQLQKRPILPLLTALEKNGIKYSLNQDLPANIDSFVPILSNPHHICTVSGKLNNGKFLIEKGASTQFICGLLFALPLLNGSSQILIPKPFKASSYVNLTIEVLTGFGVRVLHEENENYIILQFDGNQEFSAPEETRIQGDWSNAAFWAAANSLSPLEVKCNGLDEDSNQGDKAILDFIKTINTKEEATIDLSDCPDLAPIVAILAATTQGIFTIKNIDRPFAKESDRVEALIYNLAKLGINIKESDEGLIIHGKEILGGGEILSSFADHRIVMALAIASIKCSGPIIIKNFQAVNKSYPSFFEDFKKVGGDFILV